MKEVKVKTGQKTKYSGQYKIKGTENEITLISGKKVPPTSFGKTEFILTDKTKHSKKT